MEFHLYHILYHIVLVSFLFCLCLGLSVFVCSCIFMYRIICIVSLSLFIFSYVFLRRSFRTVAYGAAVVVDVAGAAGTTGAAVLLASNIAFCAQYIGASSTPNK